MAQAKYQEIADRLRDQIDSGALQPGDRLPSEPDLVKTFDASRNTVRLAIALLTNRGLVVTRQGLGTFVNEPAAPFTALLSKVRAHSSTPGPAPIHPQVNNIDVEEETSRLMVEKSPASPSVAEKLEVEPGDLVVIRRRNGTIGGIPWMMMASYFPLDVAVGTPLEQHGEMTVGRIKLLPHLA